MKREHIKDSTRTVRACLAVTVLSIVGLLSPGTPMVHAIVEQHRAGPTEPSPFVPIARTTVGEWKYVQYENLLAPCSISGYQTFVIGTKQGSSDSETSPLWVRMRGGGVGWFDADGAPMPTDGMKTQETLDEQLKYDSPGLMALAKESPEGFRVLIVSMCSHDIYAGNNNADPNNPNVTPDGDPRPTTGLVATGAAIRYTMARYPTDDFVLHGTSAGGVGTFHVAWALEHHGLAPTALVSDSGVLNQSWQQYVADNGIPGSIGCEKATQDRGDGVLARIAPIIGDPANEPHLLVAEGRLTVPVMHVWNRNDSNVCGATPMPCPIPTDPDQELGAAACNHELMRFAIDSLPNGTRSRNMQVCVEGGDPLVECDRHVVTALANGVNSDAPPASGGDYQSEILDWVVERLADD
jgi:hypothetical protein